MNINIKRPFDEMQEKALGKAGIICSIVTILYLVIEATYKYNLTKDILDCTWEIILILIICIIYRLCTIDPKEMNLPKSVLGKKLPTEQTKQARKKRLISYICESILFATISFIFDYIFDSEVPAYPFIELISLFIISLFIDYIIGEKRCKSYTEWEIYLDK